MDWTHSTILGNAGNGIRFDGRLEAMVVDNVIAHNGSRGVAINGPLTDHGAGVL